MEKEFSFFFFLSAFFCKRSCILISAPFSPSELCLMFAHLYKYSHGVPYPGLACHAKRAKFGDKKVPGDTLSSASATHTHTALS